jgi:hypothetical protein
VNVRRIWTRWAGNGAGDGACKRERAPLLMLMELILSGTWRLGKHRHRTQLYVGSYLNLGSLPRYVPSCLLDCPPGVHCA